MFLNLRHTGETVLKRSGNWIYPQIFNNTSSGKSYSRTPIRNTYPEEHLPPRVIVVTRDESKIQNVTPEN